MTRFNTILHKTVALGVLATLLVSGCAVGPDFKRPAPPDVKTYTDSALPAQTAASDTIGGAAQTFVDNKDIPAQWWTLFASAPLNALMEQALKTNSDLQAAQAALRVSQETVYAEQGVFFPSVTLNPSVTREKFSPAVLGDSTGSSSIFTLYNASVNVSYGLDIFGGNRREVELLQAQADYQKYQLQATYLTLTTNIVTAAIQEASLRAQIKATQNIIDIESHELDILKKQFELGGIAKSIVLTQETAVAQAEATLPPLQKQLAQKRTQLSVLAGRFPSEKLEETFDLDSLHLPEELPVSLPSKLVEQRPDIQSSESVLHAASAGIGVATANMLPQVTLTGSYGSEATSFGNLFSGPAEVWSLGGGLLQPLFRGGTLLHERNAAVAAYDQAAANYRSTVLTAFQNVADTLRALQFDADTLKAQLHAERAASESLELTNAQFKDGAISYPQLLNVQQAYQQTHITLVLAQAARFADTAALFQALGGGWQQAGSPEKTIQTSTNTSSDTSLNGGKK